jgi:hypothetical protein
MRTNVDLLYWFTLVVGMIYFGLLLFRGRGKRMTKIFEYLVCVMAFIIVIIWIWEDLLH